MSSLEIALIGTGNMGSSLLAGLVAHGFKPETIWVADPSAEKLAHMKNTYHVNITTNNLEAIKNAGIIILAVKPQIMHHVALEIADVVKKHKPLILSIAAGLSIANFEQWLGKNIPIIRTMPNTAAHIGCSASALFANPIVTTTQRELAESILNAVGISVWVDDEKQMDTVTSLSGNGPAYFFLLIEMLVNAAEKLGLTKEIARKLANQTALGAARLATETNEDAAELRRKVTSPGGTTEAATRFLEDNHVREIFFNALQQSNHRAAELATLFKKEE